MGALPTFCLLVMDKIEKYIKELLAPDIHLMDVKENHEYDTLRVVVDSEKPVSIDIITDITKRIQESEEIDNLFPNGYKMEVTSAGVTANLEKPFQFRKNIGRKLKLKINSDGTMKVIRSILKDIDETGISVENNNNLKHIDYANIKQANVIISFS